MLLNLLITVLFLGPFIAAESLDPAFNDDVLGLIVFKTGLSDPQSKLSSWNEDDYTPCNWAGVKCDRRNNRVTDLNLSGFSLSGHIGRSLLKLDSLRTLSLANNNFTGTLNPILTQIQNLRFIDFSQNGLSGSIPEEFFDQCRSLIAISLSKNYLTGSVPQSLSSCSTLERVNFSSNFLSGTLPTGIWSLIGLKSLDVSDNLFEGEIPQGIHNLYDLRVLSLKKNKLTGPLPGEIGRCLLVRSLDFSENSLSGFLPISMQKLSLCTSLSISHNSFTGELPEWIGDMKSLWSLDISANNFSGRVPNTIGGLQYLKELNLSRNQFTGELPNSLANCVNLLSLDVSLNLLTGNLPSWAFGLGLKTLSLSSNRFSGSIVYPSMALIGDIEVLDLSSNVLSGEIPLGIGNFRSLQLLNMSRNSLTGYIPTSIGELKGPNVIDLSYNRVNGTIPSEIGRLVSLQELRLERNFLTGIIPTQIQNCSSLKTLILSNNNLTGQIPLTIVNLTDLEIVDLSFNHLSGGLPKDLTNLSNLVSFNISHNDLQGELPVGGFFNTIPLSSVAFNPALCGSIVKHSCPAVHPKPIVLNPNSSSDSAHKGSLFPNLHHKKIILSISALIAIGAAVLIALGVLTVSVLNLRVRSSMSRSTAPLALSGGDDYSQSHTPESNYGKLVMFSGEVDFGDGANALLNKDSELGRGGFGAVYHTVLRDGRSVAIKKLNVTSLMKSQGDFDKEVKKLGKIRHGNLVTLDGYYWTPSLQLLITEYVCNGSLYKNLHEGKSNNGISWQQRFNVILGTARGLSHLHKLGVIHYNLKSTNVLLDDFGEPKVGDFGLARLLPVLDRCILSSKIQSALGYMAPEFSCQTVKITEKCDVYAFGVLTLEVVTGKRPVEYMEDDVVVLCDMVRDALEQGRAEECVDQNLNGNFRVEEAIPVIKLGLICASQVPSNRPDMEEVIKILELIQCPSESQEELE
ncbi:hypothetical protein LguiA_016494 [Lonicera macranthoides]